MHCSGKIVSELVKDAHFPKMLKIRQRFDGQTMPDVSESLRKLLTENGIANDIRPGMRIAVTCGSRGIANIPDIIREVCAFLRAKGAEPFILPSMGSHGGATAEGQRAIVESYGVTEQYCGAPILATTDAVCIGQTGEGEGVYINRLAASADGIVVVNRIKPHTDFRGLFESGVLKMMVIGLGGPRGAEIYHRFGAGRMAERLQTFGKVIVDNAPILCGIAILENARDQTSKIEVIRRNEIMPREPQLLEEARRLMGRIMFDEVDVLIIDRIGKNISGDGMDPNITGTFSTPYASGGIKARKRVVLDLTDETHGNFTGLGMADVTTHRCFEKCDFEATYPTALLNTIFTSFKIPLVLKNDKEAIGACLKYCGDNDKLNPRVVRIKDTEHISEILISEAMLSEAKNNPNIDILSEPCFMRFDENGNLIA